MSSFNSSPHDGHSPQSFAQERWTDDQIQHGKTRAAGKSLVTIHCISDIRRYLCRAEADIPEASHALLDNLRVQCIFVDGCTWPAFLVTQVSYLLKARQAKAKADDRERERDLGQPCVAGFFKSLQLGKIISNNPPLACISLLTRSLRWPWRCIISLVRWLRQIRLSREQVRQKMTASNAMFDSSKLHLTCRQQNAARLSNKQL